MNLFDRYSPSLDINPRPDAPHQVQSATSTAAAAQLDQQKRVIDRERIYRYIADRLWDGACRFEIAADLNLSGDTVRPRVVELIEEGRVIETERTRLTPRNRPAAVLIVRKVDPV